MFLVRRPAATILAVLTLIAPSRVQAQFPYNYAPYTPRNLPNYTPYAAPTEDQSPQSLSQAMLNAHNAVRARVSDPPLIWSDQLAPTAAGEAIAGPSSPRPSTYSAWPPALYHHGDRVRFVHDRVEGEGKLVASSPTHGALRPCIDPETDVALP
jgi:hypothetical protein